MVVSLITPSHPCGCFIKLEPHCPGEDTRMIAGEVISPHASAFRRVCFAEYFPLRQEEVTRTACGPGKYGSRCRLSRSSRERNGIELIIRAGGSRSQRYSFLVRIVLGAVRASCCERERKNTGDCSCLLKGGRNTAAGERRIRKMLLLNTQFHLLSCLVLIARIPSIWIGASTPTVRVRTSNFWGTMARSHRVTRLSRCNVERKPKSPAIPE